MQQLIDKMVTIRSKPTHCPCGDAEHRLPPDTTVHATP